MSFLTNQCHVFVLLDPFFGELVLVTSQVMNILDPFDQMSMSNKHMMALHLRRDVHGGSRVFDNAA